MLDTCNVFSWQQLLQGEVCLPCSWFQMGLFMELDPEEMMMGMEGNLDDPDLEAELAAITGNKVAAGGKAKPKGKSECSGYDSSMGVGTRPL